MNDLTFQEVLKEKTAQREGEKEEPAEEQQKTDTPATMTDLQPAEPEQTQE